MIGNSDDGGTFNNGAFDVGSNFLQMGMNFQVLKKQNAVAKAEAQRNRDFQERMSNTAMQRRVEDLRAAGLNPALAYENSASSPGGTQANIGSPDAAMNSVANASRWNEVRMNRQAQSLALKQAEATLRKTNAEERAIGAQNNRDTSNALATDAQRALYINELTARLQMQPGLYRQQQAQNALLMMQQPAARNAANWEEFISGKPNIFLKGLGEASKFIPRFKF